MIEKKPQIVDLLKDKPYHGLLDVMLILDSKVRFGKWYSEDNTALGFMLNVGKFQGVFVYIMRDSIVIEDGVIKFKHEIIKNPKQLSNADFKSPEFWMLCTEAMNEIIAEFLEWQKELHGT